MEFLSHTPPVAASADDKPSTARRRTAGPRHGTYERQNGSDWGGRQPELSSSMEALRLRGPPKPPRPPRGGRHAVRRLRSVATLRQQNVVDENQANAIKDLLVLGDHDELHAALDRYGNRRPTTRLHQRRRWVVFFPILRLFSRHLSQVRREQHDRFQRIGGIGQKRWPRDDARK